MSHHYYFIVSCMVCITQANRLKSYIINISSLFICVWSIFFFTVIFPSNPINYDVREKLLDNTTLVSTRYPEVASYDSCSQNNVLVIDKNIKVLGRTVLKKYLKTEGNAFIHGKLKVNKKARFKKNVTVNGILTTKHLNITENILAQDVVINGDLQYTKFTSKGVVHNDAFGNFSSSLVIDSDVDPAAGIVDTKLATISTAGKVANSATSATATNTANTIVMRDALGNFTTTSISITGAVINPTDVATKAYVDSSVPSSGSSSNIPNTLVLRDGSGNFSASIITANLNGNAVTATSATNFSGPLAGDVIGTQGATIVSTVGGQAATNVAAATVLTNAATSANTANAIVRRSATGGFSTTAISVADEVISNTLTITPFATAGVIHNDASGLLSSSLIVNADVDPAAAIVDTKLATISTAEKVANSATTATAVNTPNTIVLRDGSGNFTTTMITLTGSVTNPTDATTKAYVDAAVIPSTGTNLNIPNTIVERDNTGSFSAEVVSLIDTVLTGNIILGNSINTNMGNIIKNGVSFIHNHGTNNTFIGTNAGNFSTSGIGRNSGLGTHALSNITNGSNNIAIGYQAGQALTTGSGNIYISANAAIGNENSTIRIGSSQAACFIAGIAGTGVSGDAVVVDINGKLGITLSSERFKHDIQNMGSCSSAILQLRPVTFIYKDDATNTKQYGLIAEEVNEILPAIVAKDESGIAYTVRYHLLPILLLNELQKQHKIITEQQHKINELEEYKVIINDLKKALIDLKKEFDAINGRIIA